MISDLNTYLIYISMDTIFSLLFSLFLSSTLSMRFSKVKYIIAYICCFLVIDYVSVSLMTPQPINNIIGIISVLLLSFIFSNDKPHKIILYSLIPYVVHVLTLMPYLLLCSLVFGNALIAFGPNVTALTNGIISSLLMPLPLFLISRLLLRKKTDLSDITVTFLLSELAFQTIFVFFCLHVYLGNISFPFFMSGLLLFILASILLSFYMIRRAIRINRENSRRELIEDRYKQLSIQYENLRNSYLSYRKLRHDLKDHIRIIDGLAQRSETADLSEYTKKLTENWDSLTAATFCDLPAADIILSEKYSIAVGNGIDTEFSLSGLNQLEADSVYLCSIFSNLLNNAIEAAVQCRGEKFIKLRSGIQMDNLVITCRNSVPEKRTPKPDSENHGFGLKIIYELAEQLGGNFVYDKDKECFSAVVTLPIKE